MSVALRLYEQLTEAGEDETHTKLIADAFEQLEDCYSHLKEVATHGHVRESELRLIREVDGKLRKEIKEVERRLQTEIKEVEIQIKNTEIRLTQTIHRQTLWVICSVVAVVAGIRLLEWFLAHLPLT